MPPHPLDVGYGIPFVVEATLAYDPRTDGKFLWRQISGPSLSEVRVSGGRFEARTAPATPDDVAREPAWGIVPVSARGDGEITLEVTWQPASGEPPLRRSIEVAAASRSHGLPNVAVDEGILFAGGGWSIARAPKGAAAGLESVSNLARLIPDVPGEWLVRDGAGHSLSIQAGRYDETPLDCGRSECHAPIAAAAVDSPMTEALRSLPSATRACAQPCHATGGSGAHDGGFADVARELGTVLAETPWEELPCDLRRSGGVTCLGCHGPGAIPEPSARWAVLRADVCATCHDAPPTYGHVAAWRSSRMARADADPTARSLEECARCHTTSGFLAGIAGKTDTRRAPPETGPIGIACAACHAPHDARARSSRGPLLRSVPLPAWAAGDPGAKDATTSFVAAGTSTICFSCHSPARPDPTRAPAASAALIWAGRGGIDPPTGRPIARLAVHADEGSACLSCHDGGPGGLETGTGHGFKASPSACTRCHAEGTFDGASLDDQLRVEAKALMGVLAHRGAFGGVGVAPETHHRSAMQLPETALGRAAYDVLLVLEDPAAASHNEPYARALLDAARREATAPVVGASQ
jgi:hypothetical protein